MHLDSDITDNKQMCCCFCCEEVYYYVINIFDFLFHTFLASIKFVIVLYYTFKAPSCYNNRKINKVKLKCFITSNIKEKKNCIQDWSYVSNVTHTNRMQMLSIMNKDK